MAGQKETLRKLLSEKGGDARVFTNLTLLKQERKIRMMREGTEAAWDMNGKCAHPAGSYGWLTDVLLIGYHAVRTQDGDILVCKQSQTVGDVNWNWS